MFGEEVSGVRLTLDLSELELASSQSLLDPKAVALEMPQLPESLPLTNTDRGRAVRPHAGRHLDPHICQQRLISKADPAGLNHSVELSLAAAECYRRLGGRP